MDVGKDFREAFLESFWGEPQAMLMYVRTCWEMYFWGEGWRDSPKDSRRGIREDMYLE